MTAVTPAVATNRPNAPPVTDSASDSIVSCRNSRRRDAPNACRTVNSWRRAVLRASSRLATFAQAMSSTNPAPPNSSRTIGRISPTIWSRSPITAASTIQVPSPYRARSRLAMPLASALALSRVTPGARRATTCQLCAVRLGVRRCRSLASHMSVLAGNANEGGITPTTAKVCCPMVSDRSVIAAVPAKRAVHKRWLTTTAGVPFDPRSSGRNVRPRIGETSRTRKKSLETS
jgi:hypothetical protein